MKVLLIRPLWHFDHQAICAPLGMLYLASAARKWVTPTPEISIYHMEREGATLSDFKRKLEEYQPDVVGFSTASAEAAGLDALLPWTRKILPNAFTVVGGPHATFFHDRIVDKPEIDAVVIGEAEHTFVELLDKLQSDRDWRDINGITYMNKSEKVLLPPRETIKNLDELPYPAYDLIDVPDYSRFHNMNGFLAAWPYMSIFTSRACPFGCIYCHNMFGKKYRAHSPEYVLGEIRTLYEDYGIRELHIVDDIFNWDIERSKAICRAIIDSGMKLKIAFPNGIRGDRFDDELIELMARAGTYNMVFAVESASVRIQRLMQKNLDVNKTRENMQKAIDAGIIPSTFYMIGFPSETEQEIRETINFAVNSPALKASFFSVLAYPGTRLYELAEKIDPHFKFSEEKFNDLHYWTDIFHKGDHNGPNVYMLVKLAYRRFYLKPWRIWKILKMYPKNRNFIKTAAFGLSVIFLGRAWEKVRARFLRFKSAVKPRVIESSTVDKPPAKSSDK